MLVMNFCLSAEGMLLNIDWKELEGIIYLIHFLSSLCVLLYLQSQFYSGCWTLVAVQAQLLPDLWYLQDIYSGTFLFEFYNTVIK